MAAFLEGDGVVVKPTPLANSAPRHVAPAAPRPVGVREVEGLVVSEFLVRGPATATSHLHATASLSLLLHGGYRVETAGGSFEARAPLVALFPANVRRSVLFPRGTSAFLWIDLPDELTARLGEVRTNACGFVPLSSGRPEWLAHRILADAREADSASAFLIQGRVLELLGALARSSGAAPPPQPEWLPRALEAIHGHAGRVPLERLARLCGLHPAHLSRAFKRHMGCSVGEYSRQSRVSRARTLLLASSLSLAEIAVECGFADQAHFSREFKRWVGSTPSRFRRRAAR
jgi:AraC family transcriptional regulator